MDVVRGEILPGYVQKVRDDGKLDIGLRAFGGKQKSLEVSDQIMDLLKDSPDGTLEVGDKSAPAEINRLFPGVSKTVRTTSLEGGCADRKCDALSTGQLTVLYDVAVWSFPLFVTSSFQAFKRAIGALYKKGLITPSKTSISINEVAEQ